MDKWMYNHVPYGSFKKKTNTHTQFKMTESEIQTRPKASMFHFVLKFVNFLV